MTTSIKLNRCRFYIDLKKFTIESNEKKDLLFKFLDLEEGDAKKH